MKDADTSLLVGEKGGFEPTILVFGLLEMHAFDYEANRINKYQSYVHCVNNRLLLAATIREPFSFFTFRFITRIA
jgi:hypothetical protein